MEVRKLGPQAKAFLLAVLLGVFFLGFASALVYVTAFGLSKVFEFENNFSYYYLEDDYYRYAYDCSNNLKCIEDPKNVEKCR